MTDWLITNAELVNEGRRFHADLRIRGERIEAIGSGLAARADSRCSMPRACGCCQA